MTRKRIGVAVAALLLVACAQPADTPELRL